MSNLNRPTEQPVQAKMALAFFVLLAAILAVAAGYYHQRWQNQLKRTARLQKQIEILTATKVPLLKVDPTTPTK